MAGNECSLGFGSLRTIDHGSIERIDGEPRTPGSTESRHSGAAIIKKKRFVPEKFCPCTCSYESEVCA